MRSLALKLALAFVAVSVLGLGLAAVLAQQSTTAEFDRFLGEQARSNFVDAVTAYYQAAGSLAGADNYLRRGQSPPAGSQPSAPRYVLADLDRQVVVAAGGHHLGDRLAPAAWEAATPLTVDGVVVGRYFNAEAPPERNAAAADFLARMNRALLIAGAVGTAAALTLGLLLARTLTRPLRELTAALRAMTAGALKQEVPVRSQDELGTLTAAFNHMSADLAREQQLRRQMTADIAHDLRSPLTVITGYLEALRDGVLPPSPERFAAMHGEARQLQRLVEDLRTLSLADAGELPLTRAPLAPAGLLDRTAAAYRQRAEQQAVALAVEAEPDLPAVLADADRLAQVLGNLVSNALRYTPAGGRITLAARRAGRGVHLTVSDTGAGIAPADLPRIFERFYRADAARAEGEGASGLGLAIARSLVEAHGGRLTAASQLGQGTTFTLELDAA